MPSIFSRIISGEIPCNMVAENEHFLAFLDINPLVLGHVLVVPKKETDYIFDIEDDKLAEFILFSKKVAGALRKSVTCKRIGVAVIGLEVPHAHIHLVPMNTVGDINFSRRKLSPKKEELQAMAARIRSNVDL